MTPCSRACARRYRTRGGNCATNRSTNSWKPASTDWSAMANSRRSGRGASVTAPGLAARVERRVRAVVRPGDRVLVGWSGGLDSAVLLDVLDRVASRYRIRLAALHVNHQLSPNATRWETFCRRVCRERSIAFRSV